MNRLSMAAFAVLLAVGLLPAQEAGWGTVKGRIVWGPKDIPEPKGIEAVNTNADKAHCLKDGALKDENWVVDKKSRGLRWTIVWLINDDPKDKTPLPIHPDLKKIDKIKVEVDQPVCAFVPHTLAMRVGQVLVVKNSSPVSHSFKWTGAKNMGNITVPAGKEVALADLEAEKFPMQIGCAFHTWMNGYIGVFNHPYFAVTDAAGNFEIKNAPAGKYRLVAHNGSWLGGTKGGAGRPIVIPAGDTLDVGSLEFTP